MSEPTYDHALAICTLAQATEALPADCAQWTVELDGSRADVFCVLDNPELAARIRELMGEGRRMTTPTTTEFPMPGRPA
jgi:hypothetical protein